MRVKSIWPEVGREGKEWLKIRRKKKVYNWAKGILKRVIRTSCNMSKRNSVSDLPMGKPEG